MYGIAALYIGLGILYFLYKCKIIPNSKFVKQIFLMLFVKICFISFIYGLFFKDNKLNLTPADLYKQVHSKIQSDIELQKHG